MTKLEVCQAVLADNTRSESDRNKAISILKRIADDVSDADCAEARRLLSSLPPSQEEEDALILKALDYKRPEGPYEPLRDPERNYEPRLQKLVGLLRCDPMFIDDGWARQPGYALQCVADLRALYLRTKSDRIRAEVVDELRLIAKWLKDERARTEAQKFLKEQSL